MGGIQKDATASRDTHIRWTVTSMPDEEGTSARVLL